MRMKFLFAMVVFALTVHSSLSSSRAGDSVGSVGDDTFFAESSAIDSKELQQSRGKQVPFLGISPQAFAALGSGSGSAGGDDAVDPEGLKSLISAFATSAGGGTVRAEIYNITPSTTTGDTLQNGGLSIAGRASPANYNLQSSFPMGVVNQQGLRGIVGSGIGSP